MSTALVCDYCGRHEAVPIGPENGGQARPPDGWIFFRPLVGKGDHPYQEEARHFCRWDCVAGWASGRHEAEEGL